MNALLDRRAIEAQRFEHEPRARKGVEDATPELEHGQCDFAEVVVAAECNGFTEAKRRRLDGGRTCRSGEAPGRLRKAKKRFGMKQVGTRWIDVHIRDSVVDGREAGRGGITEVRNLKRGGFLGE